MTLVLTADLVCQNEAIVEYGLDDTSDAVFPADFHGLMRILFAEADTPIGISLHPHDNISLGLARWRWKDYLEPELAR